MNILIVKLSAIGDVIHTLPALAALRRCYPVADITWVVEEASGDLLAGHPALNRVIVSRRKTWMKEIRRGRIAAPLKEMHAFFKALRSRPYDLVIDFHGLLKSAVIVAASGGRRKLGYDSMQEFSGLFYDEKIPEEMGKHAVDRYLDFVRHLAEGRKNGAACLAAPPEFTIAIEEEQESRVAAMLDEHAAMLLSHGAGHPPLLRAPHPFPAGDRPGAEAESGGEGMQGGKPHFVAINPFAFWETKLWEEEKFAELGDRIRVELGIGVVLTAVEASPLDRIRSRMKTEAVNLGGRTTLRELACLYRQAAVLVTTDSGPMHLAAAMGTPVVALFGPTDPARTGPYGPGHRVIRRDLPCMPCFRKHCEDPRCMTEISVEEVFEAVREMLAAPSASQWRGGQRGSA